MEIVKSEGKVVKNDKTFEPMIQKKFVADDEFTEEFVDEEYKRTTPLTPKCEEFYRKLQIQFGGRKSPVAFKEIAEWAEEVGWSYYVAVQWMRMLWKAGKVRRFYKGLWQNAVQGNVTGLKWGVAYLLEGEQDETKLD